LSERSVHSEKVCHAEIAHGVSRCAEERLTG
jgi:hypothetical protein